MNDKKQKLIEGWAFLGKKLGESLAQEMTLYPGNAQYTASADVELQDHIGQAQLTLVLIPKGAKSQG